MRTARWFSQGWMNWVYFYFHVLVSLFPLYHFCLFVFLFLFFEQVFINSDQERRSWYVPEEGLWRVVMIMSDIFWMLDVSTSLYSLSIKALALFPPVKWFRQKTQSFPKIASDTKLGGLTNDLESKKNSLQVLYKLERLVATKKLKFSSKMKKILHLDSDNQLLRWRMVKILFGSKCRKYFRFPCKFL